MPREGRHENYRCVTHVWLTSDFIWFFLTSLFTEDESLAATSSEIRINKKPKWDSCRETWVHVYVMIKSMGACSWGSSDPPESRLLALGLLAPRLVVLVCAIHWWATRLVPGNNHRVIRQSPSAHQRLRSHNNLHRFFTGTTLHHIHLK